MVDIYVDPDATGNADGTTWTDAYTTLAAALTSIETATYSEFTDDHTIHVRSSSGTADTGAYDTHPINYDDTTYTLYIEAASGDEAQKDGIDVTRYRLANGTRIAVPNLVIDGLQFDFTSRSQLQIEGSGPAAGEHLIKNCYFRENTTADRLNRCIYVDYDAGTVQVENCIFADPQNQMRTGIYVNDGTVNVYNCAFAETTTYAAVDNIGGTVAVYNSLFIGCADDINGTVTVDYNIADDADAQGAHGAGPSGSSWANEVSDYAAGDMTLVAGGNAEDGGIGPGSDADVPSTDMEGDSRSGATCDAGVDEGAAAATTTVGRLIHGGLVNAGLTNGRLS